MSSIFCASSIVRGAAVAKRKGDRSPGFIEPCLATLREADHAAIRLQSPTPGRCMSTQFLYGSQFLGEPFFDLFARLSRSARFTCPIAAHLQL
jgi:hypothetical protein